MATRNDLLMKVPFNRPCVTGRETEYLERAIADRRLSGNGPLTRECQRLLREMTGARAVFLTTSCTTALEMSTILADLGAGDEVIMPSFTFVSTAQAVVARGAVPVFVDVRPDTLNLDEGRIEEAITAKTRAILPVHYAGVGCEMEAIQEIAERHRLLVIEDAAQALLASYRSRPLGSFGPCAALSFHETKNLTCGEGGALLLNDEAWIRRAEIVWEKGTNRAGFFRGEVDKYTWVDRGSSFLPSELTAAFLLPQLEEADAITRQRRRTWSRYHEELESLELAGTLRRPVVPEECEANGHLYYILLRDLEQRSQMIDFLRSRDVGAVFHYVPLHSSPAGRRYGRPHGELRQTEAVSERLLRLPLWYGMGEREIDAVVAAVRAFF